jgi:KUP system potassium uptake protein
MSLNCFPRVTIRHKSALVGGQIYIEEINWALCALGVAIICGFSLNQATPTVNTTLLSNAYGVAVLSVMVCTTCLVTLVIIIVWRKHVLIALAFFCTFIFIEGIYFSATLFKIPHGAWFPLAIAAGVFSISYLWKWGTSRRLAHSSAHGVQLDDVIQEHDSPDGPVLSVISSGQTLLRAPGAAVFYADNLHNVPPAFVKLLSTFPTVHNVSIFLTIRQVPVPTVGKHERMLIREMPFAGFYRAVVRYGYMDEVDQGHEFVEDVLNNVERFLAAKVAALRRNESANLDNVDVPTGGLALDFAKHTDPEVELKRLKAARGVKDIVYIRSRSRVTAAPGSNPFKRLLVSAYNTLYMFARSPIAASKIPVDSLCEIGIMYAI